MLATNVPLYEAGVNTNFVLLKLSVRVQGGILMNLPPYGLTSLNRIGCLCLSVSVLNT